MKKRLVFLLIAMLSVGVSNSYAILYTGFLSSPANSGLYSDGQAWASPPGFRVNWEVSEAGPATWHYKYTFSDENAGELSMLVSHMTISLSDNIEESDLFNFSVDVADWELDTFETHLSNPGFPVGETIFGIKINMGSAQLVAEFDSSRKPMWGDFYAKGGGIPNNYAYNTDFGVEVANLHDYAGTPIDASGNQLHKILVPNSTPEPASLVLLGLGSLALRRRRA